MSAHRYKALKFVRAISVHASLLALSVLFLLPLLWMILTSLSNDKQQGTQDRFLWVPKTQKNLQQTGKAEPLYETQFQGMTLRGRVVQQKKAGSILLEVLEPASLAKQTVEVTNVQPVLETQLNWQNYSEVLSNLPKETNQGLQPFLNSLCISLLCALGTLLSCSLVAYGFARLRFPGKEALFTLLLSSLMLPSAITMLPTFMIFRELGWVDTLLPLWVPSLFASAFYVFLLKQFLLTIPSEHDDAAKLDGSNHFQILWKILLPQIKPALIFVALWSFIGAWNDLSAPLIYLSSPEKMPLTYLLQLFQSENTQRPALIMALATLTSLPVLLVTVTLLWPAMGKIRFTRPR